MEKLVLGRRALEQIRSVIRNYDRDRRTEKPATPTIPAQLAFIAVAPAGGIPARSTDTPGSATCTVKFINASGDLETKTKRDGNDLQITVYNISSGAISADAYIQVKQETFSGKYVADFEDC